jgi:uncharacterized protein
MKKYKLSRYNDLFIRNGKNYLWNTYSDALFEMDDNALKTYQEFGGNYSDTEFFRTMLFHKCIVLSRKDELGRVLFNEKSIMLNQTPTAMTVTIAPGLGCNYDCVYCFEKNRQSRKAMDQLSQDAVYKFITSRILANKRLKKLIVTWFGGEPLLYMEIIQALSKRLMKFCEKNGIEYSAGAITNGRYLTPENVDILKECKVTHVQLSMDGMEQKYIEAKKALPGDFEATVDNIRKSCDKIRISIRINILGGDVKEANRLTEYLLKDNHLDGRIKIYIAHVRNYDDNWTPEEEHKDHAAFLEAEKEYVAQFKEGGKYFLSSFQLRYPCYHGATCNNVCSANLCVGPEGELYQCEHYFGMEDQTIGNVVDGCDYNDTKMKYLREEHYDKCLKCRFFPSCMGGCLDDKVNHHDMIDCEKYTEEMEDMVVLEYQRRMQRQKNTSPAK